MLLRHPNVSAVTRGLVTAWLIAEIAIWTLAWAIGMLSTPNRAGLILPQSPVEVLSTWDGAHYEAIARNGYSTEGSEARRFGFFPALPAISRLLGGDQHAVLAGVLLNQLCLLASILLIGTLAKDGAPLGQIYSHPGFWMLVAPVSFFFSVYYSESLFLLFSLLSVIAYRRDRIGWACLVGALAGLTRPTAVCLPALFIPDLVGRLRRGERWIGTLACAAAPLAGFGLYVAYVGWRNGDLMAYVHLRETWWQYAQTVPFQPLLRDFHLFLNGGSSDQWIRLVSSVFILGLIAWGWRKIDPGFLTYLLAGTLFIHSQGDPSGTVRYELVLFPGFLLSGQLTAGRPRLAWTFAILCIAAQIYFFYRYATWRWVA